MSWCENEKTDKIVDVDEVNVLLIFNRNFTSVFALALSRKSRSFVIRTASVLLYEAERE